MNDAATGAKAVTLQAPATVTTGYTLTLPAADGAENQVLKTNGSGQLGWTNAGGGAVSYHPDLVGGGTQTYLTVRASAVGVTVQPYQLGFDAAGVTSTYMNKFIVNIPSGVYLYSCQYIGASTDLGYGALSPVACFEFVYSDSKNNTISDVQFPNNVIEYDAAGVCRSI